MARVQGANAAELTKTVSSLRSASVPAESLNDRLKALINQAPIMLFMKGTPEGAQCRFSRTMLDILNKYDVRFGSFNVLSDDTVREGKFHFSVFFLLDLICKVCPYAKVFFRHRTKSVL